MIHRQNYLDIRAYLDHIERVRQNDPATVKRTRSHLRHLLEWADETPLPQVRGLDPTFPVYLLTARDDGKDRPLAPASLAKCLRMTRQCLAFLRAEHPLRYKPLSAAWLESLVPPRPARASARLPVRELWTLDQVRQVASVATETLREERARAAVCLLFLSGMRADALASLPRTCVDLDHRTLAQLPERGVRTKNHKAALTYLLNIPDLLDIVQRWDATLNAFRLPPSALWYATLSTDGMALTGAEHASLHRDSAVRRDVQLICHKAGVPYLSPHKLRHGHTVYALKRAGTVAQLKAVSQNIMHESLVTTDQIYGRLVHDDVREIIGSL